MAEKNCLCPLNKGSQSPHIPLLAKVQFKERNIGFCSVLMGCLDWWKQLSSSNNLPCTHAPIQWSHWRLQSPQTQRIRTHRFANRKNSGHVFASTQKSVTDLKPHHKINCWCPCGGPCVLLLQITREVGPTTEETIDLAFSISFMSVLGLSRKGRQRMEIIVHNGSQSIFHISGLEDYEIWAVV